MQIFKSKTLSSITNGTVIDHIRKGMALKIFRLLALDRHEEVVSLALNLASSCMESKDLIKIENRTLSDEEANKIAVLAPESTIVLIENGKITRKFAVVAPKEICGYFTCTNPNCITHFEKIGGKFQVMRKNRLQCSYCQHICSIDEAERAYY